jgi:hypothetical protein
MDTHKRFGRMKAIICTLIRAFDFDLAVLHDDILQKPGAYYKFYFEEGT